MFAHNQWILIFQGAPPKIPGDSILIFNVELIKIERRDDLWTCWKIQKNITLCQAHLLKPEDMVKSHTLFELITVNLMEMAMSKNFQSWNVIQTIQTHFVNT